MLALDFHRRSNHYNPSWYTLLWRMHRQDRHGVMFAGLRHLVLGRQGERRVGRALAALLPGVQWLGWPTGTGNLTRTAPASRSSICSTYATRCRPRCATAAARSVSTPTIAERENADFAAGI
jgi:hypothetical protein